MEELDEISIVVADITNMDVDAVVNAANSGLRAGGGVRRFAVLQRVFFKTDKNSHGKPEICFTPAQTVQNSDGHILRQYAGKK